MTVQRNIGKRAQERERGIDPMMDLIMPKKKEQTDQGNENENTLCKWGYKKLYRLTKHRNRGSWDGQGDTWEIARKLSG